MTKKFKNNTTLIFILLITFFPGLSFAQQQRPQGPPPAPNAEQIEKMLDDLAEKLALSEEQSQIISKLYIAHFDEVKELQESQDESRDSQRKKMDKLKTDFEKQVKEVLTDEQQKQFDEFVKEQSKRRPRRPEGRPQ